MIFSWFYLKPKSSMTFFLLKCQVDIVPVIKLGKITKLSKLLTLFLQNSGSEKSRLIWQGLI